MLSCGPPPKFAKYDTVVLLAKNTVSVYSNFPFSYGMVVEQQSAFLGFKSGKLEFGYI